MTTRIKRILCVEDDPDACEILRFAFEHKGYQVVTADSAKEARVKIANEYFDLYLLDVYLDGTDGFALCREVRLLDARVPVIMFSADAQPFIQQQALEAGATYFLPKPIDPIELAHLARFCVGRTDLRVLEARVAEMRAIHDELAEWHQRLDARLTKAKEMSAKVKEHQLKITAFQAFSAAGGTRAAFERLWPDIYQNEMLS